jgi:hypothetical protein
MTRLITACALCLAILAAPAVAQQNAPPPAQQTDADRTMEGQLVKVDSTAKLITVKDKEGKETIISYNDQTQIAGADDSQALTGKTGSNLKITYRENRGMNVASKIEVVQAQPKG